MGTLVSPTHYLSTLDRRQLVSFGFEIGDAMSIEIFTTPSGTAEKIRLPNTTEIIQNNIDQEEGPSD